MHVDIYACFHDLVTDTGNHESVSESLSGESDEKMKIQYWRRDRFLRETYLDSIRVILTLVCISYACSVIVCVEC